jgi:AraC-like DNA-binding protein
MSNEAVTRVVAHLKRHALPLRKDETEEEKAARLAQLKPRALAAVARYSVPHCYVLLKAETQQTPTQIVRQARVDYADHLLATTELEVQAIAEQCDFEDPFYFSRVYKHVRSLAPTAARQAMKNST